MKNYLLLVLAMTTVSLQASVADTANLNAQLWQELNTQQDAAFDYKPVTIDRIKRLIEAGADINSRNPSKLLSDEKILNTPEKGDTPLIAAVEMSHFPLVKWLLEHGAKLNFTNTFNEWAPLYYAARGLHATDPELIELLLKYGANVNQKNRFGQTPLVIAQEYFSHDSRISQGNQRIINILKARGAR